MIWRINKVFATSELKKLWDKHSPIDWGTSKHILIHHNSKLCIANRMDRSGNSLLAESKPITLVTPDTLTLSQSLQTDLSALQVVKMVQPCCGIWTNQNISTLYKLVTKSMLWSFLQTDIGFALPPLQKSPSLISRRRQRSTLSNQNSSKQARKLKNHNVYLSAGLLMVKHSSLDTPTTRFELGLSCQDRCEQYHEKCRSRIWCIMINYGERQSQWNVWVFDKLIKQHATLSCYHILKQFKAQLAIMPELIYCYGLLKFQHIRLEWSLTKSNQKDCSKLQPPSWHLPFSYFVELALIILSTPSI